MQQRLSITKAGASAMRWLLVQAAWAVRVRCRSPEARPLQMWALETGKAPRETDRHRGTGAKACRHPLRTLA